MEEPLSAFIMLHESSPVPGPGQTSFRIELFDLATLPKATPTAPAAVLRRRNVASRAA